MTTLVSLAALRTFVEVARLRSFKDAAQNLGVTSGAVSQQIKLVESRLAVTLFERSGRNVKLTEHGLRLLGAIHVPFEQIREAVEDLHNRRSARNVVRIVTPTALASHWLVPRIDVFSRLHPEIEVRIDTADVQNVRREPFDIAIQYGGETAPGIDAKRLPSSKLVVVGSPQLLRGSLPILDPSDCLKFPLLHDQDKLNWPSWFRANGLRHLPATSRKGFSFTDESLLVAAAAASQGLALVRDIHAENLLMTGSLEIAIEKPMEPFQSYYILTPSLISQRPVVRICKDWILTEMAKPVALGASAEYREQQSAFRLN